MEIELDNVIRDAGNDSYEYYYYLSANQSENNIQDWVKLSNVKVGNNKLSFTINTKDIANYADIANSENLYLYINEIAIKGTSKKGEEFGAYKLNVSGNMQVYVDDVLKTEDSGKDTGKDPTTAGTTIPHTGKNAIITLIVIAIVGTAIGYSKFRVYKEIK